MRQGQPHIVRQNAAAVACCEWASTGAQGTTGVSSFAFQGTNAHVLLACMEPAIPLLGPRGCASASNAGAEWRRRRLWYAEPWRALLQQCATSPVAPALSMSCHLNSPSLAYLIDHQVGQLHAAQHGFWGCVCAYSVTIVS
jgi:hypothetical protein